MAGKDQQVTPFHRVRWARQISEWRAQDPPREWKAIASDIGISVRNCQKLLRQFEEFGEPDAPFDREVLVQRHLDHMEVIVQEAWRTFEAAPEGSAVRIGALRVAEAVAERRVTFMQVAGLLPRNLAAIPLERDLQQLLAGIVEVMRRHNASDEMLEDIARLAEGRRQPTIQSRALAA